MPRRKRSAPVSGVAGIIVLVLLVIFAVYRLWPRGEAPLAWTPVPATQQGQSAALPAATQAVATKPAAAPTAAAPATGEGISVWFSDPLAKKSTGGVEIHLVEAINNAQKTVDVAIYNLSLPAIGDALRAAHQRGVRVRLVMESEAMDKSVPRALKAAGIPIVGDQKEGLMHNKFTVIDGAEVWTGSMNYTSTSFYNDFNNLVRIQSAKVADDYTANFEEMFTDHRFGPNKQPNTPYPQVEVGGAAVQVYFSPDDGAAKHVVDALMGAQKSIDILAYSFTRDDFANAINLRANAGVKVSGVFDADQNQSNTGAEFPMFLKRGYDVHLDRIPGLLHDKIMVIDGRVVITGSYNFSGNAERTNDENLVIIQDAAIAAQYLENFQQVLENAEKGD